MAPVGTWGHGSSPLSRWNKFWERLEDLYRSDQWISPHERPELGLIAWIVADHYTPAHIKATVGGLPGKAKSQHLTVSVKTEDSSQ